MGRISKGIFWPLILISLGVIFLLKNTGIISGETLDSFIPFWPVILILMGLDSFYRGEGRIGATLTIAMGVVFLMSNFGYLALGVWQIVIRVWPLFLLAAGLDILVGRRSCLGSLLGALFLLAILIGSLWVLGDGELIIQSTFGVSWV